MSLLPSYEVWTWIKGYEGRYEISNRGRIRSWVGPGITKKTKGCIKFISTPLIRKAFPNKFGYWTIKIGNKSKKDVVSARLHREVAIYFVHNSDPINKVEVNHINGDKKCNEWWNLEWVTRMESIDHAFSTGLIKPAVGESQSNTKLTNNMVMEIYRIIAPTKEIAKLFSISTHTVLDIKRGRTWWHLTGHSRHIKPSEKGRFKKQ